MTTPLFFQDFPNTACARITFNGEWEQKKCGKSSNFVCRKGTLAAHKIWCNLKPRNDVRSHHTFRKQWKILFITWENGNFCLEIRKRCIEVNTPLSLPFFLTVCLTALLSLSVSLCLSCLCMGEYEQLSPCIVVSISMSPLTMNQPERIYRWISARLQCVSNGDTAVLHWVIDTVKPVSNLKITTKRERKTYLLGCHGVSMSKQICINPPVANIWHIIMLTWHERRGALGQCQLNCLFNDCSCKQGKHQTSYDCPFVSSLQSGWWEFPSQRACNATVFLYHHYDDVVWTPCCLKSPVIRLFV